MAYVLREVGRRRWPAAMAAVVAAAGLAAPAPAYLFWSRPAFKGEPVVGDEPGIAVPLAGANPKEVKANLLWAMRAGLNVAALQCQFAPALMTVNNYNGLLKLHGTEFKSAYDALSAYFRRTGGKGWQTALDQYTTRTYNGFSTLHAQLDFCETAASIGREALAQKPGQLGQIAINRMREFRASLVPSSDMAFAVHTENVPNLPTPAIPCVDRKGREIACKS